jgi:bacterial/archaeal transporter family-2 protein
MMFAFLAGVSIVVSRTINANLSTKIGTFQGTFFNFATGLLFSLLILLFSDESLSMSIAPLQSVPPFIYLGGIVGVITIVLSNYITPKISAFYLTIFIFVGQLFAGVIIDFLTLGDVSIGKIIGGFLVLLGLVYNVVLDNRDKVFKDSRKKEYTY